MKPKVLILYNKLFHYRIPIWNILAEKCNLTVAYSIGDVPDGLEMKFNVMYLPIKKTGPFIIHNNNIRKIAKRYDVIIAYGNIAWLKLTFLPWFNRTKVVYHTIGVSASYSKGYDERHEWDRIRAFFYNKADALAFYTQYPIEKYEHLGIKREKMFEAPNTVEVIPVKDGVKRNSILFIGTLYRAKGLQLLLDAFSELKDSCNLPVLNVIGNGPDYNYTKQWIEDHGLQELIKLEGAIYDIGIKAVFFSKAIACISPKQAGLSVLESMGYGVPFVTTRDAITGGELFNIHNGKDGVILDHESQIKSAIIDISENPDKYISMGLEAKKFYDENRTPQHMADGLWNAVCYVLKN